MTAAITISGGQDATSRQYLNIAAQATTVVKASRGTLRRIVMNKATANGVITVYDNASAGSGTKIATITSPGTLLKNQFELDYDAAFNNGLTIVGSGADQDFTVIFD